MKAATPHRAEWLLRGLVVLIPLGVLGNVALSLLTTDRAHLEALKLLPKGPLVVAATLAVVPWFTSSLRLCIWTRFIGQSLSFGRALRVTLGSMLGSAVTPTATGSGFFKWGLLMRAGLRPGTAASLISLELVEDNLFFLVAVPTALALSSAWEIPQLRSVAEYAQQELSWLLPTVVLAVLGLVGLWRLGMSGRLGRRVQRPLLRGWSSIRERFHRAARDFRAVFQLVARHGKRRMAFTLLLTAIQWTTRYSVVTAVAIFLGAEVQPVLFWLLQWLVFTVMAVIPTPGAVGGAEATFLVLYQPFLPGALLGLTTAGWRLLTFYFPLALGSVVFLLLGALGQRVARRSQPA